MAKAKSEEIVPVTEGSTLTMSQRQDAVTALTSLAELQNMFRSTVEWSEIETSFEVASKETFEGTPFVIAGFRLNESDKFQKRNDNGELEKGTFISMLVAGYDEGTGEFTTPWVIINDGSTGIKQQLGRFVMRVNPDAGKTPLEFNYTAAEVPPIKCTNGLRRSDYDYDDGNSVTTATTWYIA